MVETGVRLRPPTGEDATHRTQEPQVPHFDAVQLLLVD